MTGERLLSADDHESALRPAGLASGNASEPSERIVVVVPTLNEETAIVACVESLLAQSPPARRVIVADGGSTDGTRQIVEQLAKTDPRVELLDNPKRLQAAAVNLVARTVASDADILIRADAHAVYAPGFLDCLLSAYRRTGAKSVVVPMTAFGNTPFQRAVAAAQNSRLGNGGAAHRRSDACSGFVEHGHHALFDLPFFLKVGGYDETFSHNEDFEFDHRLRPAGAKIWMSAEAAIAYLPRATPASLARQYYNHGKGRGRTLVKHRLIPRLRQVLPLLVLLSGCVGVPLSLAFWPAILPLGAYLLVCFAWAAWLAVRDRELSLLLAGPAAVIMHFAWALGVLSALAKGLLERKRRDRRLP